MRLARFVFVIGALSLLIPVVAAASNETPIIPGARKIARGRYTSPRNYNDTLHYYRRKFRSRGGVRWRTIIHMPTVKAKHLKNMRRNGNWDGINIYEHNGKVRIYVLERPKQKKR